MVSDEFFIDENPLVRWETLSKTMLDNQCSQAMVDETRDLMQEGKITLLLFAEGFILVRPASHYGKSGLIVWFAFSKARDGLYRYTEKLFQLARAAGLDYVEFETERAGFEKMAPKFGYEKVSTTWRKIF